MDIELILYIIFVAIALLTRAFKNRKENNTPHPQDTDTMDVPQQRPQRGMTFEELLREFTGEAQPQQSEKRREIVAPEKEVFDHETQETYKRSVREAKALKTLDEQVDLNAPLSRFESFSHKDGEENEIAVDILDTLKDEEGARKAIILSEIINRKY